jgi:hypothetical protein
LRKVTLNWETLRWKSQLCFPHNLVLKWPKQCGISKKIQPLPLLYLARQKGVVSKVVLGFPNVRNDLWGVVCDVWRWLCRHLYHFFGSCRLGTPMCDRKSNYKILSNQYYYLINIHLILIPNLTGIYRKVRFSVSFYILFLDCFNYVICNYWHLCQSVFILSVLFSEPFVVSYAL